MEGTKINDIQEPPTAGPGKLVLRYLQNNCNGATTSEIFSFVQDRTGNETDSDLQKTLRNILMKGTTFGFLERKGSHFVSWVAREMCGSRRRRRSGCRRRRRSGCKRRRRCRYGCRRKRSCRC